MDKKEMTKNGVTKMGEKGQIGYVNYAYSLFLFIKRLYVELEKEGIEEVFFFSREGEFLKKLFDEYMLLKNDDYKIVSKYLFVSRQSTFSASLRDDYKEESFDRLFSQNKNMSISGFLKNLCVSGYDCELIKSKLECDCDELIQNFQESDRYAELNNLPLWESVYTRTICNNRNALLQYLSEQGFFDYEKVAIVDVGWKGSIQDNISIASHNRNTINGYYIGLCGDVVTNKYCRKKGLLFYDYPMKSEYFDIWNFDSHFFERLLTASHPSTKGYDNISGTMEPVFNSFGREKDNYEMIKPLQKSILSQFKSVYVIAQNNNMTKEQEEKWVLNNHIAALTDVNADSLKFQHILLNGQQENFGLQMGNEQHIVNKMKSASILSKCKKMYKALNNPLLISRFLCFKGYYDLSALIIRLQKRKLQKML